MLGVATARAAEPYIIDDASIVEKGACQLEAVNHKSRARHEWRLLPACNLIGNVEVTLGMVSASAPDAPRETVYVAQFKGVWRELEPNQDAWGWAVGTAARRHPAVGQSRVGGYSGSLLYTRSFLDDKIIAHVNLGARRDRDERRYAVMGGVAAEFNIAPRVALIAEAADDSHARRAYQTGIRYTAVPERVDINFSIGGEAGDFRQTRYWTVGVQLTTPPFIK